MREEKNICVDSTKFFFLFLFSSQSMRKLQKHSIFFSQTKRSVQRRKSNGYYICQRDKDWIRLGYTIVLDCRIQMAGLHNWLD